MGEGESYKLQPDPPVAGQPVEITYNGPADEISIQVDGKEIKLRPKDKKVVFQVPIAEELMLYDGTRGQRGFLHRWIEHLG